MTSQSCDNDKSLQRLSSVGLHVEAIIFFLVICMACNYHRNGCWKLAASDDIAVYGAVANIRQFEGLQCDMGDNWAMSYISKLY